MAKYRKLPVEVEAVLYDGTENSIVEILNLVDISKSPTNAVYPRIDHIIINTLEGQMRAEKGDYIIKGVEGELYPCKPDIFKKTYERATK